MKAAIKKWLTEQFGDDGEIIAQAYALYHADMRKGADELDVLSAAGDFQGIGRKAHAMKGMALTVGDRDAADICLKLEQAGKTGDASARADCVAAVRSAVLSLDAS